jgi:hypothetical protein
MIRMAKKLRELRTSPFIRLEGCPVSIGDLMMLLAELGGIQNPYFDKRQIVGFNKAYLAWRTTSAYRRILGKPYQVHGPAERGDARPILED